MREQVVTVPDILKIVQLTLVHEQGRSNGVYGRITPSLIEEATGVVEMVEKVHIGFTAVKGKIHDLKVCPLL